MARDLILFACLILCAWSLLSYATAPDVVTAQRVSADATIQPLQTLVARQATMLAPVTRTPTPSCYIANIYHC